MKQLAEDPQRVVGHELNEPKVISALLEERDASGSSSTDLVPTHRGEHHLYRQLLGCKTVVQLASSVAAALRGRPDLEGVLPVPKAVLFHCYALGLPGQAQAALECLRLLRVDARERWSATERERWVLHHAKLYAAMGEWRVALGIVANEKVVRRSARDLLQRYIADVSLWRRALKAVKRPSSDSVLVAAIERTETWSAALSVFQRHPSPGAASALAARADFVEASSWAESLRVFSLGSSPTFAALRLILARIPRDHSDLIVLYSRGTARVLGRMNPGVLTRRAFHHVQRQQWAEAIGLLCGGSYYDIALPVAAYMRRLVDHSVDRGFPALPHELLEFERVSALLRAGHANQEWLSAGQQRSRDQLEVKVGGAHVAVLLHVANRLLGSPNQQEGLLSGPEIPSNGMEGAVPDALRCIAWEARERSLLLALKIHVDGPEVALTPCRDDISGSVDCFSFQSATLTKAVTSCATATSQRYFLSTIPGALHGHHWSKPVLGLERFSHPIAAYERLWNSGFCAVSSAEYDRVLRRIIRMLRERGALGELAFLQEVARWLAAGRFIEPHPTLALSVLRYCFAGEVALLSYSAAARIGVTLPIQQVFSEERAATSCVRGFALLGMWEQALRFLRLARPPYGLPYATAMYAAPRTVALRVLWKLYAVDRDPFIPVLLDLMHDDTRSLREALAAHAAVPRSRGGTNERQRGGTGSASSRRVLVGAAICNLTSSAALMSAARATRPRGTFTVVDCDELGAQKLMHALPWEIALTAVGDLSDLGTVAEEHTLVAICGKPRTPPAAVMRMAALLPYSRPLGALAIVAADFGGASGSLRRSLTSLLVFFQSIPKVAAPGMVYSAYLVAFTVHLRQVLTTYTASAWTADTTKLSRRLFNAVTEQPQLTEFAKLARKLLPRAMKAPQETSGVFILAFLLVHLSRHTQLPVAAAFVSRVVHSAVFYDADDEPPRQALRRDVDWHSAAFFFECQKHPTEEERCCLLLAVRDCAPETQCDVLMSKYGFIHHRPEQLVWWQHVATQLQLRALGEGDVPALLPATEAVVDSRPECFKSSTKNFSQCREATAWLVALQLLQAASGGAEASSSCTERSGNSASGCSSGSSDPGVLFRRLHPAWNWYAALQLHRSLRALPASVGFRAAWRRVFVDEPLGSTWAAALQAESNSRVRRRELWLRSTSSRRTNSELDGMEKGG